MIRDMDHAIAVQRRRFKAKRKGIAAAVKRYLRAVHGKRYYTELRDFERHGRDGGR